MKTNFETEKLNEARQRSAASRRIFRPHFAEVSIFFMHCVLPSVRTPFYRANRRDVRACHTQHVYMQKECDSSPPPSEQKMENFWQYIAKGVHSQTAY